MTKKLLPIAIAVAGLGATLLWLISTESGLRAAWRLAVPAASALADIDIHAGQLHGRLLGPLSIEGLSYRDPSVGVDIDQARIDWRPLQLLSSRVTVDALSIGQIQLTLQATHSNNPDAAPQDSTLPITLHIERATIDKLVIRAAADSEAWLFEDTVLSANVLEDSVQIRHLGSRAYGVNGQLEGFISWHGQFPLALNAAFTQTLPDNSIITSELEAAGDLSQFQLDLSTQPPYRSKLKMDWRAVPAGYEIRLQGPLEPAPLLVALELLPPEALASGEFEVDAQGILGTGAFEAQRLQITHKQSQLHARGKIDWRQPALAWTADIDWQQLSLPPWQPQIHSERGQAQARGNMTSGQASIDAAYQVPDQQAGQAQLLLSWVESAFELKQGSLQAERSQISARGQIWPRASLAWSVQSPDLGELWPAASGRINGQGTFAGDWLAPKVAGQLEGRNIQLAGLRMQQISLNADLDLETDRQGQLKSQISALQFGTQQSLDLVLDLNGKRSAHTLSATWKNPQLSGAITARGGWPGGNAAWSGRLENFSLKTQDTQPWSLASASAIRLHPEQASLDATCLVQNAARLCLQGDKQLRQWRGSAQLSQLPLDQLADFLPTSMQIQGKADAEARITGTGGDWQSLQVNAQAKTELSRPAVKDRLALTLHNLAINADPQQATASLALHINGKGRLTATAQAQPQKTGAWRAARLRGNLSLDVPRLQELTLIAPEIEQLRGEIKGDIQATGSIGQPRFGGQLTLNNGQLDLRDYGISIAPLTATVSGQSDGHLDLQLDASSGGGTLSASGQLNTNAQTSALSLAIVGDRFLASRTDEATVYISPKLQLAVANKKAELVGELLIPAARLQPGQQQAAAQTVSGDQIMVNDQAADTRQAAWQLLARLRLILGDQVFFNGAGVDTRLTGQLDIRETPDKPTIANGEIRLVDGVYEVYGQALDIDTGRLIFANAPITEPALDIKASRVPRPNIKVGVRVRGLLDAPQVALFSTPSMRQAEQLSYLILGRPLEGNEGNPSLTGAALALGLNRGDQYIKGLGESLRVDDIGIETTPGQSADKASLVVGKYLSPRLYVSYGAGLFETLHKLRMRYRMSEHWTLVGESGTAQGADILYTIER